MTALSRWLPLAALLICLLPAEAAAQADGALPPSDLRARLRRLSPLQQDEVLWLARCLYSESDRAHEQRLVAWVVRNRVETHYRGASYREVVLEPRQFSAFNTPSIRRNHILGLGLHSPLSAWRQALGVALAVFQAPASQRPFAATTRHFYSPVSMDGGRTPPWAQGAAPLSSAKLGVDPHRFQFFADVDEGDPPPAPVASATAPREAVSHATPRRLSLRSRLGRRFSGRVKRPLRPHLARRGKG